MTCVHSKDENGRCMPLGHTWRSEDLIQCDWWDDDDIDEDTGGPSRCMASREEHEPCNEEEDTP